MIKVCKTEQSAERQRGIERALFELMKKKPYDNISVTELCEALSMPRKAFYRYFDTKDSALRSFIEQTLAEFPQLREGRDQRKRSLLLEIGDFFIFWLERRELLDVLGKNGLLGIIIETSVSFPIENLVSLQRLLPDDDERERIAVFRFAIGGLMSTMLEWYRDGFKTSVTDMSRLAVRILSKPPFPKLEQLGMSE